VGTTDPHSIRQYRTVAVATLCPETVAIASPGKQSAEHGEKRTISRREGLALHLASEHGHFVAQCEELDLVGVVAVSHDDGELEQAANGEVHEGPKPSPHPVSCHLADRSRSGLDPEVPAQQCNRVFG
jgi:hypothetical protein